MTPEREALAAARDAEKLAMRCWPDPDRVPPRAWDAIACLHGAVATLEELAEGRLVDPADERRAEAPGTADGRLERAARDIVDRGPTPPRMRALRDALLGLDDARRIVAPAVVRDAPPATVAPGPADDDGPVRPVVRSARRTATR